MRQRGENVNFSYGFLFVFSLSLYTTREKVARFEMTVKNEQPLKRPRRVADVKTFFGLFFSTLCDTTTIEKLVLPAETTPEAVFFFFFSPGQTRSLISHTDGTLDGPRLDFSSSLLLLSCTADSLPLYRP